MNTHIATRDGMVMFRGTENECFGYILEHQSQSVSWAIKNEGWDIEPEIQSTGDTLHAYMNENPLNGISQLRTIVYGGFTGYEIEAMRLWIDHRAKDCKERILTTIQKAI